MYGSNYPPSYGGGGYPPPPGFGGPMNSGPPPPPMFMQPQYGAQHVSHGAYNVNQYGTPNAPYMQQMQQQYQQQGGMMPQPAQMPATMMMDNMNQMMMGMGMFNAQMKMLKQLGVFEGEDDDEDEEWDEEEDEETKKEKYKKKSEKMQNKAEKAAEALKDNEELREQMKRMFIAEMLRRQEANGMFELTQGTVQPFEKYGSGDPVNVFKGGELTDKEWDPEMDCEYLRDAMNGAGTNEEAIINVVSTRCNAQRQTLKKMFKTMYGRDLIEDIDSELSGDFRETVMALFVKPAYYDAWTIKTAIQGAGTNEHALLEVLMTRTNSQIEEIRSVYADAQTANSDISGQVLEKDVEDDTSGDFKRLLISACQGNRYEVSESRLREAVNFDDKTGILSVDYSILVDKDKAARDAQALFEAGEDKWGTDEERFNIIFSTRDVYQLRATWDEYVKLSQRDILNTVDRETSGDLEDGLRAIVMNIRCRPMYFAERLKAAMKGAGTDEAALIRIIVSRAEIDMVQIKKSFLELTHQTLWNWLNDDCSGDYRKVLQAVVGRN